MNGLQNGMKYRLADIARAAGCINGICCLLRAMQAAEDTGDDWPLAGNEFVKGSLVDAADLLAESIDMNLVGFLDMAGIEEYELYE